MDAEFSAKESGWQSSELLHVILPIVWCRLSLFSSVSFATLVYWLLQILGSWREDIFLLQFLTRE